MERGEGRGEERGEEAGEGTHRDLGLLDGRSRIDGQQRARWTAVRPRTAVADPGSTNDDAGRGRLTGRRTLRAMDGLLQSIGDGLTGMIGGALAAIESALVGMGNALASALPAGALPVLGVGLLLLVGIWLLRR